MDPRHGRCLRRLCEDDCIDAEEAFEAAGDPFEFGDEGSGDEAA